MIAGPRINYAALEEARQKRAACSLWLRNQCGGGLSPCRRFPPKKAYVPPQTTVSIRETLSPKKPH
jgi:hypothetical protein